MFVSDVRRLRKVADALLYWLFRSINLSMAVALAIEVLRPHRMNGPAMNMSRFSMTMIRFGMDMKQRSREHPKGCPQQNRHARPRACFTLRLHHTFRLAQFFECFNL